MDGLMLSNSTRYPNKNIQQSSLLSIKAQQVSDPPETAKVYASDETLLKESLSKEEIWSALLECWRPVTAVSRLEHSADGPTINSAILDEPRSHIIKRFCQDWWLMHSPDPWDNILSENHMAAPLNPKYLRLMFSSWYQDLLAGSSNYPRGGHLLLPSGTVHSPEGRVVEQLVHDISLHFGRTAVSVRAIPAGNSTSTAPLASSSTSNRKLNGTSKGKGKRRDRGDTKSDDDGLDDDDPNQDDRAKRIKKTTEEYNRYVICQQFAAGQEPAHPNCFFGAWCSVDRLKQDHLINVHNFSSSQLKIDRGGTESEKWWRLFDKLNPGFREANPEAFIPGPFWEDRVAHNTYNKVFSEAMKQAERIRDMRTQSLASDIQNLLNRQRDVERQEVRQVILEILHSRTQNATVNESPDITERTESESNGFHPTDGGTFTPQYQQPNTESESSSRLRNRHLQVASESSVSGLTNSFNKPPVHGVLSDDHELTTPSLWEHPHGEFGMGTQSTYDNLTPQLSDMLGGQFGADLATTTTSSSETMSGTLSSANDLDIDQPFGKVCRCRFHSAECDLGVGNGNEWCACCSGWFPWSAFAEPFIMR
ncbi:hypothetical protein N431DRAFT_512375 [Stipitochalara longipes BDJ]|nr:hypothetical protein N431DRAFT_512375 [Stipitochalara longipes BDJ]